MESTEKESNRNQKDITYLREQMEKLRSVDPDLFRHIQKEVKDKVLSNYKFISLKTNAYLFSKL